jgi:probable rRNA maturation factor
MLSVPVANNQTRHAIETALLSRAARTVAEEYGFQEGEISIAVVDDATMHALNRRYLDHDYPTDVLSFLLEQEGERLEGEIIVSADYASREAPKYGWTLREELALYVVHGALHLVGYDDTTPEAKAIMQEQETVFLRKLAIERSR